MSILPQAIRDAVHNSLLGARQLLLPASCLLCGSDSDTSGYSEPALLCPACNADLPRLPDAHCPQCALPTPLGEFCGACLREPPAFSRSFAAFTYAFPVDRLIQALKYGHQLAVAPWAAAALARCIADTDEIDHLIPLPLHPERLRTRGFNQAGVVAGYLEKHLDIPVDRSSLIRSRPTQPQAALPHRERSRNVRGAFECRCDFSGQRLLLIDDVLTTGATARECARVLRLHGAADVRLAVIARAYGHAHEHGSTGAKP